jgi:hypothetical protein
MDDKDKKHAETLTSFSLKTILMFPSIDCFYKAWAEEQKAASYAGILCIKKPHL